MTPIEYNNIKRQIRTIEELMPTYSGRTLDNILSQLRAKAAFEEQRLDAAIHLFP